MAWLFAEQPGRYDGYAVTTTVCMRSGGDDDQIHDLVGTCEPHLNGEEPRTPAPSITAASEAG